MARLVLGPLLRHVGAEDATIWVETEAPCEVEVCGCSDRTFEIEGHHFALVHVTGLEPEEARPYDVRLDGELVWPLDDGWPASCIRTIGDDHGLRISFGSCRVAHPDEPPWTLTKDEDPRGREHDALRTLAMKMRAQDVEDWPHLLLLLGDQVYADEVPVSTAEFIAARRDPSVPPGYEVADFEEYCRLYEDSWSEPSVRWLLSTVPTAMIFDDHDVHDDWNTSDAWVRGMRGKGWWDARIVGGFMSYWVFQHLGNLSPAQLAEGGLYDAVRSAGDAAALLASRMDTEGRQVGHSRWSFARDLGGARLVVIDSRAGRQVTPGGRELVQDEEWDWIREQALKPARHLLLASSVPFLLAPGLHHVEAFDEALTEGAWGRVGAMLGEKLRRAAVVDHWASFQRTFRKLVDLLDDVAHGRVGDAPASIVMLSGDVHHCYLAEVGFRDAARSRVWQAVCSAFRKELAPEEKRVIAFGHSVVAERLARRLARAAGVRPLSLDWRVVERPAYANQVATLTLDGEHASLVVEAVAGDDWRAPGLAPAITRDLT